MCSDNNHAFSPKNVTSCTCSPGTIITGKQSNFNKQFRCPYGAYVEDHNNRNFNNQIIDKTQGSICLGPKGNLQGTYALLFLCTRRNMTLSQFTELPTPPRITQQFISMAMYEKQKKVWSSRTVKGWSDL